MAGLNDAARSRARFALVNLLGGLAVLGSYAIWLGHRPDDAGRLWGSVDGPLRSAYFVSMLLATVGYFAFAPALLRADPRRVDLDRATFLLSLVLFPSALWMPLAFEFLAHPGPLAWWAMRAVLATVGFASLALALQVASRRAEIPGGRLATAGAFAFTFQTLVLDAFTWPEWFP
ncbi:MAG: hypothetical protein ACKO2K_01970 [Alphaproteobacteria bacterium]